SHFRLRERLAPGPTEEIGVLGIRSGPPALDVLDAELVEAPGDLDLVVDRERQAFALCAVAQGRVVQYRVHNLTSPGGSQKHNGLSCCERPRRACPGSSIRQ